VLQCVAVCCSVLQCVAVCCSVLQCVAVCCSVLQCIHSSIHPMNESCHMCMCYTYVRIHTYENYTLQLFLDIWWIHICENTHVTGLVHRMDGWMTHLYIYIYEWVIRIHTHMNKSCHIYEWVMSHLRMSPVAYMTESCHTCILTYMYYHIRVIRVFVGRIQNTSMYSHNICPVTCMRQRQRSPRYPKHMSCHMYATAQSEVPKCLRTYLVRIT